MSKQLSEHDTGVLRRLAEQLAEIADLPIQEERSENHRRIENLEQAKPTVRIYQIPWHEMNVDDELTLACEDGFCRSIEQGLRRTLYQWHHMPGDMTVSPVMVQPYVIRDSGFGIDEDVDIRKTDDASSVVSRHFNIQLAEPEDVAKIKLPTVRFDPEATEEEFHARTAIFDEIMPVEKRGVSQFWFAPWDLLVRLTGVQEVLTDMILRPDFVHAMISRLVDAWLHRLDQYVDQGLLTDDPMHLWGVGAAQIFSDVSPAMHEEFALKHEARWYRRFGKNYYGCCEPLHNKVDIAVRNIPRLRKISMSPWIDFEKAVRNVGGRLIFAWKPNPAVLAAPTWDPEFVRNDMREKLAMAKDCVVEIHMKDISTVNYEPQRLWEWATIAAEETARAAE